MTKKDIAKKKRKDDKAKKRNAKESAYKKGSGEAGEGWQEKEAAKKKPMGKQKLVVFK